ncbi:hypothetical protein EDB89DRAFT_259833 [Lactarius sanguifluus]|nr:hypothetical protein EDB89DRAFT_259833 [Lactarius sanguifluus]
MPASQSSFTSSHMFYVSPFDVQPITPVPIQIHAISDFEAVVDEYLSHYQNFGAQDWHILTVVVICTEHALLQALNTTETRSDLWNPALRLLHTDDAILCIDRPFDCGHPPLQIVANVVDYIRQALEGLCILHEHKITHCAYGDPSGAMMDTDRPSSAGFDRTRLPVRYYRVNFSRAQELPREADPLGASFFRNMCDCGAMFQNSSRRSGGKLRSLGDDGGRVLRRRCSKVIRSAVREDRWVDLRGYDAPFHIP